MGFGRNSDWDEAELVNFALAKLNYEITNHLKTHSYYEKVSQFFDAAGHDPILGILRRKRQSVESPD